ncbi:MAG: hypothetical protein U0836_09515 [Pirellulales bacterium]
MSASEPLTGNLAVASESTTAHGWWTRAEGWLERAGDRLNPILVKEARQALKSKQFVMTFALVLLASWFWSVGGMLWLGPDANYRPTGQQMFFGYLVILGFPLIVVVPFGAFQSLSSEREDRTFELLSISTLKPWQFISGKLASAMLQMLVYLSAVSPCLAFTYMLRGIDILAILMMTGYVVLASLGFSALALLLATLTTEKHWQVVLSVLLILALMYCFMGGMATASQMTGEVWAFDDVWFWVANAGALSAYVSYLALVIAAAGAQLSFASDNRSTKLRVIMLLQQALWIGWFCGLWLAWGMADASLYLFAAVPLLQWGALGALMTGESPHLSRRVQRSLPQSFFGRAFLTWFNPGPGTGYLFVVANLATIWLATLVAIVVMEDRGLGALSFLTTRFPPSANDQVERVFYFVTLGSLYVTLYLGLGRLLIGLARRFASTTLFLALLVNFLLLLGGTAMPMVIQFSQDPPVRDYTLWQSFNPFWTLGDVAAARRTSHEAGTVLLIVGSATLLVFLLNLPQVIHEVQFVRVAKPRRVEEEDQAAAAEHVPAAPVKTNPWD